MLEVEAEMQRQPAGELRVTCAQRDPDLSFPDSRLGVLRDQEAHAVDAMPALEPSRAFDRQVDPLSGSLSTKTAW